MFRLVDPYKRWGLPRNSMRIVWQRICWFTGSEEQQVCVSTSTSGAASHARKGGGGYEIWFVKGTPTPVSAAQEEGRLAYERE